MFLFFDTETTGLPKDWKAPVTDVENWPRLVQLAWLTYDANGKKLDGNANIVKPDGFEIPEHASKIHGITTERAWGEGEFLDLVLKEFYGRLEMATVIIGHNITFDANIVGAEFIRAKLPAINPKPARICTMMGSRSYCALPRMKWPKLTELHQKLFGCAFEGAHDASSDIAATAKCFWKLVALGVIKI